MRRFLCVYVSLLLLSLWVQPTHAAIVDLGFQSREDIFFSEETLVTGDRVRVYARITNFGTEDVTGHVAFNQGTISLGNTQIISVRAGGAQEEVFVDFTVPESSFNIRAQIVSTDPVDEVTDNNIIISNVFEPTADEDHDSIEDSEDNCVQTANAEQTDTDADGLGDACDDDDDNDTLTDEVEDELGSDALMQDSDGDGVDDAQDAAPADANVSKVEEVEEEEEVVQLDEVVVDQDVVAQEEAQVAVAIAAENAPVLEAEEPVDTREEGVVLRASGMSFEQVSWNTYHFEVQELAEDASVRWDFGDGSSSTRTDVDHIFRNPGTYTVTATITDAYDVVITDSVDLTVSFFHWENAAVKLVVTMLLLFLVIGISILVRLRSLA